MTGRSVSQDEGIERRSRDVGNASNQEKPRLAPGSVDHSSAAPSVPRDFERFRCRRDFPIFSQPIASSETPALLLTQESEPRIFWMYLQQIRRGTSQFSRTTAYIGSRDWPRFNRRDGTTMTNKIRTTGTSSWMSTCEAAAILGVREITLRRTLERNARRRPDGTITATVDGVQARKFQRQWRISLDHIWLEPRTRSSTG